MVVNVITGTHFVWGLYLEANIPSTGHFPVVYLTRRIRTMFTKPTTLPCLVPDESSPHSIILFEKYMYFNIILSSTFRYTKWFLPFDSTTQRRVGAWCGVVAKALR
jgi:hypothetical protein